VLGGEGGNNRLLLPASHTHTNAHATVTRFSPGKSARGRRYLARRPPRRREQRQHGGGQSGGCATKNDAGQTVPSSVDHRRARRGPAVPAAAATGALHPPTQNTTFRARTRGLFTLMQLAMEYREALNVVDIIDAMAARGVGAKTSWREMVTMLDAAGRRQPSPPLAQQCWNARCMKCSSSTNSNTAGGARLSCACPLLPHPALTC